MSEVEAKEGHRVTDDQLVAAARSTTSISADVVQEMAAEILRARRAARIESRRAGQVKKLRWSVEHLLIKVEELERGDDPSTRAQLEPPWLADAARAIGEVAPDGKPLALNWTQVLRSIENLRADRDRLRLDLEAREIFPDRPAARVTVLDHSARSGLDPCNGDHGSPPCLSDQCWRNR